MDLLAVVVIVVCIVLAARAVGAHLGAATGSTFDGLFARPAQLGWPEGVQEADAPHFALDRWHGAIGGDEPQVSQIDEPVDVEGLTPTAPHWRG